MSVAEGIASSILYAPVCSNSRYDESTSIGCVQSAQKNVRNTVCVPSATSASLWPLAISFLNFLGGGTHLKPLSRTSGAGGNTPVFGSQSQGATVSAQVCDHIALVSSLLPNIAFWGVARATRCQSQGKRDPAAPRDIATRKPTVLYVLH